MKELFKKRIKKIIRSLSEKRLDSLLVSSLPNIFYLTGLKIEGYLLLNLNDKPIIFTDFRYLLQAQETVKNLNIDLAIYEYNIFRFIARKIKKLSLQKIGFEADKISYKEIEEFKKNLGEKLIPTFQLIEEQRKIKDRDEIDSIKKSVKITEETFSYLKDIIYEGLSEKFIAIEAEKFMKLKADNELAFPPIVAAGTSSAYPHHLPQEKNKVKGKTPLLIDLGSKYRGYCSDLTRVFFLSKMPDYPRKILDIVKKAKEISIKEAKEGIPIKNLDKKARDYIEKKGFAKFFKHSLGHGVGLEVHEPPSINSKNEEVLKEGMVITIEPAIYLPGKFGIREESMLLIKSNKAEVLDGHS